MDKARKHPFVAALRRACARGGAGQVGFLVPRNSAPIESAACCCKPGNHAGADCLDALLCSPSRKAGTTNPIRTHTMPYCAPTLPDSDRVRQLLRSCGIPQRRLGIAADVGEAVISRWLRGAYEPGELVAHKLRHGLGEVGLLHVLEANEPQGEIAG